MSLRSSLAEHRRAAHRKKVHNDKKKTGWRTPTASEWSIAVVALVCHAVRGPTAFIRTGRSYSIISSKQQLHTVDVALPGKS